MKQLKPLKMFVPEGDTAQYNYGLNKNPLSGNVELIFVFTRPEIHELVKAHAEKLKYWRSEDYEWHYDADCIYFWPDGEITMDGKDFSSPDITFEEIQWQDFLKLTPEDVLPDEIQEGIKTMKNDILRQCVGLSHKLEPTTTDRNEKAWKIIENLLQELMSIRKYLKSDNVPLAYSRKYLKDNDKRQYDLIQVADEFLKQAGNK